MSWVHLVAGVALNLGVALAWAGTGLGASAITGIGALLVGVAGVAALVALGRALATARYRPRSADGPFGPGLR